MRQHVKGARAALDLETEAVVRGGVTLDVRSREASVGDDGALQVGRAEAVERFANRASGLEQSWTFAEMPRGHGDLSVQIHVGGLDYKQTTESGVHFEDGATGLLIRYGNATWVDADGVATKVPARIAGKAIVLTVPSKTLEASRYPAVLDPIVSPEIGIDVAWPGASAGVAFDGTNYFVAWIDARGVVGSRIRPDGTVLDVDGIVLAPPGPYALDVVYDGTQFVVVWVEFRMNLSDSPPGVISNYGNHAHILARRIARDGALADPDEILVSDSETCFHGTACDRLSSPGVSATSHGAGVLVVWDQQEGSGIQRVRAAVMNGAGSILDVDTSSFTGETFEPSVGFDGVDYFVVWSDGAAILGSRVSVAGVVLDVPSRLIGSAGKPYRYLLCSSGAAPRIACGDAGCFVAWRDSRTMRTGSCEYQAAGAAIGADGTVLNSEGVIISDAILQNPSLDVAYDGRNYVALWSTADALVERRVSPSGLVLDAADQVVAPEHAWGALASNGQGISLVAYAGGGPLYRELVLPVSARFITTWASLTIDKLGSGGGTVTSSPSGIDCGATCVAPFDAPTAVVLTATADPGSQFVGWSGGCFGPGTCTVSTDASKSVTATFVVPPLLSAVLPSVGPVAGGSTALLLGSNLHPGASVTFGGDPATDVGIVLRLANRLTLMKCTAPPHAAGAVDVRIVNPDGGSATLAKGYRYMSWPRRARWVAAYGP